MEEGMGTRVGKPTQAEKELYDTIRRVRSERVEALTERAYSRLVDIIESDDELAVIMSDLATIQVGHSDVYEADYQQVYFLTMSHLLARIIVWQYKPRQRIFDIKDIKDVIKEVHEL